MDTISLQSHLELQINRLETYLDGRVEVLLVQIQKERELRERMTQVSHDALLLQAKEYERRLKMLNGEHGRVKEAQATFLPRETFYSYVDTQTKNIESLIKSISLTHDTDQHRLMDIERESTHRFWLLVSILIVTLIALVLRSTVM